VLRESGYNTELKGRQWSVAVLVSILSAVLRIVLPLPLNTNSLHMSSVLKNKQLNFYF
jgi:hypothetical protein